MIQLHKQLNPELWEDDRLKSDVHAHLLEIAKRFYKTLKIKVELDDVLLTGSSANFNYTPDSDIDLHLLLSFAKVNCDKEVVKNFFLAKKSLWNNEHSITIKGKDVEVYVQDTHEPHISTGIYSLFKNKWLVKPSLANFYLQDINKKEFISKLNHIKKLIDYNIHKKTNINFLQKIKDKITNMRKKGLQSSGETDIKNLIFKELRNQKYIDKLSAAINRKEDKNLSLENFSTFVYEQKQKLQTRNISSFIS